MRGTLRITSDRSPFRRAGLAWPTREPVELHISALDGARLRALLGDPALTVQIADTAGEFRALPRLDKDMTAGTLQLMIDNFAADAPPPPPAEAAPIDPSVVDAIVAAAGVPIDAVADRIGQINGDLEAARAALAVANEQIAELQSARSDLQALLDAAQADNATLLKRIADLQDVLAAQPLNPPTPVEASATAKPARGRTKD